MRGRAVGAHSLQTPVGVKTVRFGWDMTHTRAKRPEIMVKDVLDLTGSASSMDARDNGIKSGRNPREGKQSQCLIHTDYKHKRTLQHAYVNDTIRLLVTAPARPWPR